MYLIKGVISLIVVIKVILGRVGCLCMFLVSVWFCVI